MMTKKIKAAVFIEGRRTGYTPEQCGETMTVGELIARLEWYDENLPVYLNNDNGYTFGEITEYTVEQVTLDDEDEDD